jgi:glycerol-3-phosphate dehydrogenase
MRGLRVALVERGDFAGATSSRSSKLIHGGLRYLPQGQFRLVRSSLDERERLRRLTAPHLVKPLRLVFPLYRDRGPGRLQLGVGLWLYDFFARIPRAQRHRRLNRAATLAAEPLIRSEGLRGGASYYDAEGDDARLTLENALDAAYHGAAIANHVALEGFSRAGARIAAASVSDRLGGAAFELRARVFVNAAGPWLDDVRRLDDPGAAPSVRLTKGVHLVFDRERLPVREALVLGDGAGRIVFVIPYGNYVLTGTTDTDFAGEREYIAADEADVGYLLGVLRQNLRGAGPSAADVAASFAGLRALSAAGEGCAPSSVSREEVIVESASGLISVSGGKLTTHREIAARIVDRVAKGLGRGGGRSPTLETPLPGARPLTDEDLAGVGADRADGAIALGALRADLRGAIAARYGTRAAIAARIALESPELAKPLAAGCTVVAAEVVYAMRYEMAMSVGDFIVRRTALSWRDPRHARAAAGAAARMMAVEYGWNPAREQAEIAACKLSDATTASVAAEARLEGSQGD